MLRIPGAGALLATVLCAPNTHIQGVSYRGCNESKYPLVGLATWGLGEGEHKPQVILERERRMLKEKECGTEVSVCLCVCESELMRKWTAVNYDRKCAREPAVTLNTGM